MTGTLAPSRHAGAAAWQATGPAFEIDEYTGPHHHANVPHTLVVAPGLIVDKVHVGYWFWGRPSPFQLWEDLQDLLRRTKADFDPTTAQARAVWQAPMPAVAGAASHA